MPFLYSILLKLLYPTSLAVLLLFASAALRKRERASRVLCWSALGILMICGNGWFWRGPTKRLERQFLPSGPLPKADAILILSGGLESKLPPRATVEVNEAGDRLLYGAYLYRNGLASLVICTGGVATGGVAPRAAAEEMEEFLRGLAIPKDHVLKEGGSGDTHEHAVNLGPIFKQRGIRNVLLVTSAMHMPRALGVFVRSCPGIEFVPAPTDFQMTDLAVPWYRQLGYLVPTPHNLLGFSEVAHEYLGIAYYKARGWM